MLYTLNYYASTEFSGTVHMSVSSLSQAKKASRISVIGCEEEMQDLKRQLEEESAHRRQVEKELELQIQMKAESEMAAKLLEKDIHEKQDTIVSLRQQLEEIKVINLEMYRKLQVSVLRERGSQLAVSKDLISCSLLSQCMRRQLWYSSVVSNTLFGS